MIGKGGGSRTWRLCAFMLVTVSTTLAGCERGPSPGEQNALGAAVWEAQCRTCHTEGGIGPQITRPVLASRRSPGLLVDYTQQTMPYGMGGALTDDEYRAVVAFLLHEHGLLPENVAVGPASLDTFQLEHSGDQILDSNSR